MRTHRTVDAYVPATRRFLKITGLVVGLVLYLAMGAYFVVAITNPIFGMVLGFAVAIVVAMAIPLFVQMTVARLMVFYDARAPWV